VVKFIDANIFLYAYLKPKRKLKEHEVKIKEEAKKIIKKVNMGEEVIISTVHFSEIANILEENIPLEKAIEIEESILLKKNIKFIEINRKDYINSLETAKKYKIGLNDVLAYTVMREHGIKEIYSFDKDFDKLPGITRITA